MVAGRCIGKGRDKFLDYFERVKQTAREVDAEFHENYPPRLECIEGVIRRLLDADQTGAAYVETLVHVPTWEQCLGDGNHRTTTLFVGALLDAEGIEIPFDGDEERMATDLSNWVDWSKKWIGRRGTFDWPKNSAAHNHRKTTKAWLQATVGDDYTSRLTTIGPNRLRNFLSCAESVERRG